MHAFRDYRTIESLFNVVPPKDTKSFHIEWIEDLLEKPFFSSASGDSPSETAIAFHNRLIDAGARVCFPEPLTIQDWRVNALFLIGAGVDFPNFSNVANVCLHR